MEYINFINGLSHGDVIEKLSESDLFLLPSVEEGIANAVLEAMALGLPVISTDCGGMSEIIIDNKTGFLVPTRDPEAMARTIIKFCSLDEKEKTEIIHNASHTIKKSFLLKSQIKHMVSFYHNALKSA